MRLTTNELFFFSHFFFVIVVNLLHLIKKTPCSPTTEMDTVYNHQEGSYIQTFIFENTGLMSWKQSHIYSQYSSEEKEYERFNTGQARFNVFSY